MNAPIALFVYNRPEHTRRTVEALAANTLAADSDLFIYSDAPRDEGAAASVGMVRTLVHGIAGFRSVTVIERDKNWGVDASVVDGVTTLCNRFGQAIVIEDDIVTSRWFLRYVNYGLDLYRDNPSVMQIAGYQWPIRTDDMQAASFLPFTSPWGWGTWHRAWRLLDLKIAAYPEIRDDRRRRHLFNLHGAYNHFLLLHEYALGKNVVWDICWYLSVFQRGALVLYPNTSLVNNIGLDGSGMHCDPSDGGEIEVSDREIIRFPAVRTSHQLQKAVEKYLHRKQHHNLWYYIRYVLIRGIKKRITREVV